MNIINCQTYLIYKAMNRHKTMDNQTNSKSLFAEDAKDRFLYLQIVQNITVNVNRYLERKMYLYRFSYQMSGVEFTPSGTSNDV